MITAIAEQAGVALNNAAQHADEHAHSVLRGRMLELWSPKMPVLTTETESLCRKLTAELHELVGAEESSIFLCSTSGQPELGHTAYTEKFSQTFDCLPFGAAGKVMETKEQLRLNGVDDVAAFVSVSTPRKRKQPVSLLCLPVLNAHDQLKIVGAIELVGFEREFSDGDVKIASSFMIHANRVLTAHLTYKNLSQGDGLLQRAFHASSDVQRAIVFDEKGRFVNANYDIETIYDVDVTSAKVSNYADWITAMSADECLRDDLDNAYKTCKPVCNRQARFSRADGAAVGNYSVVPLLDVPDNSMTRSATDEKEPQLRGSGVPAPGVRCQGMVLFVSPTAGDGSASPGAAAENRPLSAPQVMPSDLETDKVAKLASEMKSWDYDVMAAAGRDPVQLQTIVSVMYHDLRLVDRWSIQPRVLGNFLSAACAKYRNVPFHSFTHGATVAHIMYYFMSQTRIGECLDALHKLAMITAAVCHDMDHPGHTNSYEVNSGSMLSMRYNDRSVLENHHTATSWSILRQEECNIFATLSAAELKQIRGLFVSSILFTDMAEHMSLLNKFKEVNKETPDWEPSNADECKLMCNVLLHSADLSNPARPWRIATTWAHLVGQEFNNQVKKEKEANLPYAPFMETNNELEHCKGEVGFIKFAIKPWWSHVVAVFPYLNFAFDNINSNQERYEENVKLLTDTTATQAPP